EREWQGNDAARAERLLDQCLPEEGRPDRRSWEWYYLKRLAHSDLATCLAHQNPVFSLSFSRDGKLLVSAAGPPPYGQSGGPIPSGELTLWDAERLEKVGALTGHTGGVFGATFSPDGAHVLSLGGDNTLRLWDVAGRR